jgi:hypothetical protein
MPMPKTSFRSSRILPDEFDTKLAQMGQMTPDLPTPAPAVNGQIVGNVACWP